MGPSQTLYTELRDRYNVVWTPPPTDFPNEKFDKPNDIWARFVVLDDSETQLDIGDNLKTYRILGQLIIQLFAPPGSGSITVIAKAEIIAGFYRGWCGVTVSCRTALVKKIGNDPFGWYQVNVVIPFKQDSLH